MFSNNKNIEWKTLAEIAELKRGVVLSKKTLQENIGEFPVYSSQTVNNGEIGKVNFFNFDGEYLTWTTDGAHAGTVFYRKGQFSITNVCGLIKIKEKQKINYKYLYYWISGQTKKHVLYGMGNPKLMSHQISKIKVPIPSLEEQEKIVKILDTLTKQKDTLKDTLKDTRKQYEYYLNELMTFGEVEAEWKTLSDIGIVRMCKRILKNQTNETSGIPFYKIGTFGQIPDAYIDRSVFQNYKDKYNYPKLGDILISTSGTIGRTVVFNGEDAYFQDSNIVWIENNNKLVTNEFLKYFYSYVKWRVEAGGTIKRLYNDIIYKTKIQVPSFAKQKEIVAFLDNFYKLINDLSSGLPLQIELVEKQYQYYRNQLLSF